MKLRIARKMDTKRRSGGQWWTVYSIAQLARAEIRLRKRWSRNNPAGDDGGRPTSEDYFASNRIRARRSRQVAISRTTGAGARIVALAQQHQVITSAELPAVLSSIKQARDGDD